METNKHFQGYFKVPGLKFSIFTLLVFIFFYLSLYGLALWVSYYELGNIKGQAADLAQSLSSGSNKYRKGEIAKIQNKKYALRPLIWNPKSIFVSLFGERIYFEQNIELIKKTNKK